jgi:putative flippase GtrA
MIYPLACFIFESIFHPGKDKSLKAQAVRQILAGAATTVVDILIFKLCISAGVHPLVAAVISFCGALLTSFTLTRWYVFGDVREQKKKTAVQLVIYTLVSLVSLGIAQIFLLVLHFHFMLDPVLVKIMSVPVVFVWTIVSGRFIVFNKG